jgi:hypothetical protein
MDAKLISPQGSLDGLNEAQRSAAEHYSGPLLVVAGAGTGKTKTLAARVARLIEGGADPNRIFLLPSLGVQPRRCCVALGAWLERHGRPHGRQAVGDAAG